jgi:hypothetical protein
MADMTVYIGTHSLSGSSVASFPATHTFYCPTCHRTARSMSCLAEDGGKFPKDGDVVLCDGCLTVLKCEDGASVFRVVQEAEYQSLSPELRRTLRQAAMDLLRRAPFKGQAQ